MTVGTEVADEGGEEAGVVLGALGVEGEGLGVVETGEGEEGEVSLIHF